MSYFASLILTMLSFILIIIIMICASLISYDTCISIVYSIQFGHVFKFLQGFVVKLKNQPVQRYSYDAVVDRCRISASQMTKDMFLSFSSIFLNVIFRLRLLFFFFRYALHKFPTYYF